MFWQRRRHYLVFGWLWYLVTIFPVIGLVRIGTHAYADRYTYIPLIGVAVFTVWLAADLGKNQIWRRRIAVLAAVVSVGASSLFSYQQVSYWKDSYTLYHRALTVTRNNWLAHNNLAVLHFQWGQSAEVERHLSEALLIRPEYADALINLGHLRNVQKRPLEATEAFRLAVEISPDSANSLYQLGVNLVRQGDLAGGEEMLLRLAPLDANLAEALNDMLNSAASHLN